ncbi:hypothetical protein FisN_1Hh303 [Fistulifera solaris]|uniref:Uncharacterized protein n=1 Tax=Fistulifera solaris TaxID=1519565 RepID=A0A1Z5JED9_FISSO|nr:hypothetical protein FisN_1Hh303 [Fistulifera solaris]|eukprot:GAX12370.1 hypothetical protein FisN_1Hh303 [Fistulifera solaris]
MTTLEISNTHTSFAEIRSKLEAAGKFSKFVLNSVTIDGDEEDMIAVAKHFRGKPLESATFRNVVATDSEVDLGLIVSTILVTASQFKHLQVKGMCFGAKSVIGSVSYASALESIELARCGLVDEDAMKMVDALAKASTVTCVDVTGNDFSDFCAHAFADGLKKKTSVTNVKIDKMIVGESKANGVATTAQKKSATAA